MNKNILDNYSFFYNSSRMNGVNYIFNKYMGFDVNCAVPLSISHGVDFEHCFNPMDVYSLEPIHWAYNTRIFERVKNIKPCLLIAHPWAIIASENEIVRGSGTLLIGPPPGKSNDQLLYNKIKNDIKPDWSILVKKGEKKSIDFWRSKGIYPVTAGNKNNDNFYHDLLNLLSGYRNIIGCTFSSALIFAASIGKKISFVDGYQYQSYDVLNYLDIVNFESSLSKSIVWDFYNNTEDSVTNLARDLLGFEFVSQKSRVQEDYSILLKNIQSPVFTTTKGKANLRLKIFVAKLLSRPGIVNKSLLDLKDFLNYANIYDRKSIRVNTINELSIWLHGRNSNNFISTVIPYKDGITIPGTAVDKYD